MDPVTLQQHIRTLANVDETSAPVISCYLNVGEGWLTYEEALNERTRVLRKCLTGAERRDFEGALGPIESFLRAGTERGTAGVAIFSRAGEDPFFLPLQFSVPLPNWIAVSARPNIYNLVELKDNYDRYVVLISTEDSARILGVNLGSVSEDILKTRPELRRRVGHEWTREHFQNHRRERTQQFVHEQVRMLEHLMSAGGYAHLILAGPARMTAEIRKALPKHLEVKVFDVISAAPNGRTSEIVAATLRTFLEHEERDSLAIVDRLLESVHADGLAAAGAGATLAALKAGQADVLVLAKDFQPELAWECMGCGEVDLGFLPATGCPACQGLLLRPVDTKEEMVRIAERLGCHVEVVEHSEALIRLGGVGCLLRFLTVAPGGEAE